MSGDLTHASFFSGVGGTDLGLDRAGWRTVSFSEVDPYASAVLAERWPGVPNLGDITRLAGGRAHSDLRAQDAGQGAAGERHARPPDDARGQAGRREGTAAGDRREPDAGDQPYADAVLWTGGFPCQDLSVAGKRRGMGVEGARTRSGLAYAFLDLVARHRPRGILLENVPGLLSSHGGRDMAALLGAMVELGYGVGYRVLDARYFGVPQRRRRVFIVGLSPGGRAGAIRAAEVLSVGSRCYRHPPTGVEAGPEPAAGAGVGAVVAREGKGVGHNFPDNYLVGSSPVAHSVRPRSGMPQGWNQSFVSSSPDPRGVRAPHGLARGLDDRDVAATLNSGGNDGGFRTEPGEHLVAAFTKSHMNGFDGARTTLVTGGLSAYPLLPLGLDSHRYRCCGNGVVAPVAEWLGHRLAEALS